MVKIYQVGGSVRDELLGIPNKDIDYVCVCDSFETMEKYIVDNGGTIFLSKPEFLTTRAKLKGVAADFVLARKEGTYTDGRRPDSTTIGSLDDDLSRRDFCCNAIAKREDGSLYDPFNGIQDVHDKIIRCVGNPSDRFNEDSLRILRAIRFCVTKKFNIHPSIRKELRKQSTINKLSNVSVDRIREELHKCFDCDTLLTLMLLEDYSLVRNKIFETTSIWLKPTTEL